MNEILVLLEQINYPLLFASYVASFYAANRVVKGYKLHRDFKPKNISKVSLPPELKQNYSSVDIEKLASERFGESIAEFAKTFMEKFPSNNLTNFYNNLNELKIKSKIPGSKTFLFGIGGTYSTKKKFNKHIF